MARWTGSLLVLALVVVGLGGCRNTPVRHPADLALLTGHVPAPALAAPPPAAVSGMPQGTLPLGEPEPYRLGVGDIVEVRLLPPTTVPGLEGPVVGPIKADGMLYVPVARKVLALDRTVQEVEDEIVERLTSYVSQPLVSVEVVEFRARRCRVVGEGVDSEQFLVVNGRLTLLEALVTTGATKSATADRDGAYLIRDGAAYPFSISALVDEADPAGEFVLREGDHVVVRGTDPRQDYVYVFGQVGSPRRIPMDHLGRVGTRGHLTLMGAIGEAGGIKEETADCNKICVFRGGYGDVRVFRLGVVELFRYGESVAMEPGDRVYVAPSDLARFNFGLQQFMPSLSGMGNITSLLLSAAAVSR
jgi:polysaccharide export outer membrane protein